MESPGFGAQRFHTYLIALDLCRCPSVGKVPLALPPLVAAFTAWYQTHRGDFFAPADAATALAHEKLIEGTF